MSQRRSRYRSLTAASAAAAPASSEFTAALRETLHGITDQLASEASPYENIARLCIHVKTLRDSVEETPESERPQDAFRHLDGFQTVLKIIRSASGFYHSTKRTHHQKEVLFDLLHSTLSLLADVFRDHPGNRQYFQNRVDGGGWTALQQAIASIGFGGDEFDTWSEDQLFGTLLTFAVDDATCVSLFQELHGSRNADSDSQASNTPPDVLKSVNPPSSTTEAEGSLSTHKGNHEAFVDGLIEKVHAHLKENTVLCNAGICPAIIGLWKSLPRCHTPQESPASIVVVLALSRICSMSQTNLKGLHSTGILSALLPMAFEEGNQVCACERSAVQELCGSLMKLGITTLDDARYLLRNKSPIAADFFLRMMKVTQVPAHISFDLSSNGYSVVEFPSLGRQFPPPSSASGYTFSAWIKIDTFDPSTHTTIFGVHDPTNTCFVLTYIEKDTHKLILQTSSREASRGSTPSVRFSDIVFKENEWYHVVIAHRRKSSMISGSKATLFVNGSFVEQKKCQYPGDAPPTNSSTDSFVSFTSSSTKPQPVKAFVGTPQSLSLGAKISSTKWSLASAHLYDDLLSDEVIAVHHSVGPRYNGNYQDTLGSFHTYEASSLLSIKNELLYPGKDAPKSHIVVATKYKASELLPERRVLLSILPVSVLGEDRTDSEASQLEAGLSREAAGNLDHYVRRTGISVAINAAVPSYNDALVYPNGVGTLLGGPVVVGPQALDDALSRLGGCTAIGLKLVDRAQGREGILRAVEIFLESIKGSWRNSETVERDNGYALLATLLRDKLGFSSQASTTNEFDSQSRMSEGEKDKLSFQLLSVILGFVGYNHAKPSESIITNLMAYRLLLGDCDIWRKSGMMTQKLYYKQFITFGVESRHRKYNHGRLIRMKKPLLIALKAETFTHEIFPSFLESFRMLLLADFGHDILRSLAQLITYSLHNSRPSASRTPKPRSGSARPSSSASIVSKPLPINTIFEINSGPSAIMVKREIGKELLGMYADIICEKGDSAKIRKFARTVADKWMLHLITDDDPEVVVLGAKILARLLVLEGSGFVRKFADPNRLGGFSVMQYRLKRWWDLPPLYPILFSILFAHDVAEIDFERSFDLFSLSDIFQGKTVVYPEVLPIIIGMIQQGLNSILHNQDDPDSPQTNAPSKEPDAKLEVPQLGGRKRSMSLRKELEADRQATPKKEKISGQASVLHAVITFLSQLHQNSRDFRDFALNSDYVRLLLAVLFPAIVTADAVGPDTELNSKDSALNFDGEDVIIRSTSSLGSAAEPVVRASTVEALVSTDSSGLPQRARGLRRNSSFVLLTTKKPEPTSAPSPAKLTGTNQQHNAIIEQKVSNTIVGELLELAIAVFVDQILMRKEFPGFGLPFKIPPGFQEHQAYFKSYILRNTMMNLQNKLQFEDKLLLEPQIINNLARFCNHIAEAIFEGWFLGGAEPLLDFTGFLLDHFANPDVARIKAVRLCSQAISSIRTVFLRVVLLRLSDLDCNDVTEEDALAFLNKLMYWQTTWLNQDACEGEFLKLMCYQLYQKLIGDREKIRKSAADLWRTILVQKPQETSEILEMSIGRKSLVVGFKMITELDNDAFLDWALKRKDELNKAFYGGLNRTWEDFVNQENSKTDDITRARMTRRKDKLRQWFAEEKNDGDIIFRHEITARNWSKNIFATEQLKYLRAVQDQQDNMEYHKMTFAKMDRDLRRTCAVFDEEKPCKWRLDETEGRNRMRARLIPDQTDVEEYQPKNSRSRKMRGLSIDTKVVPQSSAPSLTATPKPASLRGSGDSEVSIMDSGKPNSDNNPDRVEDEFEMIDDPRDPKDEDEFEDRQRKIMRGLRRGDQVQDVFNVSRIIGLEACEGLLILGKDCLYLRDDFFQRADGEIVHVQDAPADERDPYVGYISGSAAEGKAIIRGEQESRSWKWSEILSVSKRRFLFRDVAVEIFFEDGRSYLLTALDPATRNSLHVKMTSKATRLGDKPSAVEGEDSWRMETLKTPDDEPTSFSSRLAGLMNNSAWSPSMRRWAKGELSNFHYLMQVNTMAGRTFNDLTQYPVFPWVIADYTSDELDLNDPRTFRDLSKPMGCQTPAREREFIERYQSFAEMGEKNPFHYGTHYSSAMIVAGFLIRLQPFVQSYLLIQGGQFDHADRMFYSITAAWKSASSGTMADVRELTPEFFYLPEFLTNSNGFNFGLRQGDGGSIDNVELPPWAKGDPKIFIAKNREALESPYVSAHLHDWIDLVFGCKQMGEAAIEHTNVFHHLSYKGATDLDSIEDKQEKLQTISIIHNFGQTPHQVFTRPHQPRNAWENKPRRLDTSASSLTRVSFPLLDYSDTITSLIYSNKHDRLVCGSAFRAHMPPSYDRFMEWGNADNSIRCYSSDGKKLLGLSENTHVGQLSAMLFADSKTLVTAGEDCVLSLWNVNIKDRDKSVALTPKASLFGHRHPVSTIAVSRSFSTILSASTDGVVILWDLNRLEFVRKLASGRHVQCAQINSISGDIMLCRGQKVAMYTLNGDLILDQNVCSEVDDYIHSCAFYEGVGNEWSENNLVFTGHKRGVVNVWRKTVRNDLGRYGERTGWCLELVKCLEHVDPRKGARTTATITAVRPMSGGVFTGDEEGKAVSWVVKKEK